jgi:hypothetical protein
VTTKTYAALTTEIGTTLADNTVGAITPGVLRGLMQDILDSQGLDPYTVALLPAGTEGMRAYASNGRKVGEGAGLGTGVPVYFSNALWRVQSTDAVVAA